MTNNLKKVIIQIPCYNEEESLPITLSQLPRVLPGIEKVEWLIIDDGSTDKTVSVAVEYGVDHIIQHPSNQGLAKTFMTGLGAAIERGADIIVNTDADNQYCAEDISKLIQPIVHGEAEFVIGTRPILKTAHFSPAKKILQRIGSQIVRLVSNTDVEDAPSGFRAITRDAAKKINVFSEYTYTLETIIQAGHKGISIASVPIRTNNDLRPSRLVKDIPTYIRRSVITMLRIFVVYKPFKFYSFISIIFFAIGIGTLFRYLIIYLGGEGDGHLQSIILGSVFLLISVQTLFLGFISDLLSVNRKLLEQIKSILTP